jgi:hypothetical protein
MIVIPQKTSYISKAAAAAAKAPVATAAAPDYSASFFAHMAGTAALPAVTMSSMQQADVRGFLRNHDHQLFGPPPVLHVVIVFFILISSKR